MPLLALALQIGYALTISLAAYTTAPLRELATFLMGINLAHNLVMTLSRHNHPATTPGFLNRLERTTNLALLAALLMSGWTTGFLIQFAIALASETHRRHTPAAPAAP